MCNVAATQRFFLDSNFNQSSPTMADAAKMLRTDTLRMPTNNRVAQNQRTELSSTNFLCSTSVLYLQIDEHLLRVLIFRFRGWEGASLEWDNGNYIYARKRASSSRSLGSAGWKLLIKNSGEHPWRTGADTCGRSANGGRADPSGPVGCLQHGMALPRRCGLGLGGVSWQDGERLADSGTQRRGPAGRPPS
jgi:hypothetical protein